MMKSESVLVKSSVVLRDANSLNCNRKKLLIDRTRLWFIVDNYDFCLTGKINYVGDFKI